MSYGKTSELIADGVAASLSNSEQLASSAKLLLENEFHGPALSLAVLSLEEMGKLFLINGLIFGKPGDDRTKKYEKGRFRHKDKLDILELFPLMIIQFATVDKRFQSDDAFSKAVAIMTRKCQDQAEVLSRILPDGKLSGLDNSKQNGFYVNYIKEQGFEVPADAISPEFSRVAVEFAYTLSDLLRFLLKDNIDRYRNLISSLRAKLSAEGLEQIRELATTFVETNYGQEVDSSSLN